MRQFFTWRFWATIAVLVGLAALWAASVGRPTDANGTKADAPGPQERHVDLGAVVVVAEPSPGWTVEDGSTVGQLRLALDDGHSMTIPDGTLGESSCGALAELGGCVVLADLLGEAVVWFALVPADGLQEVRLPPIETVLDGGREAQLTNGWVVPLVDRVDRRCERESTSFRDFLARFGTDHEAVYDLALDEISALVCIA